jgi:hypothetical protein
VSTRVLYTAEGGAATLASAYTVKKPPSGMLIAGLRILESAILWCVAVEFYAGEMRWNQDRVEKRRKIKVVKVKRNTRQMKGRSEYLRIEHANYQSEARSCQQTDAKALSCQQDRRVGSVSVVECIKVG